MLMASMIYSADTGNATLNDTLYIDFRFQGGLPFQLAVPFKVNLQTMTAGDLINNINQRLAPNYFVRVLVFARQNLINMPDTTLANAYLTPGETLQAGIAEIAGLNIKGD